MQRILGKDYFVMDQWQLEEFAKVVKRCKVKVVSDGIAGRDAAQLPRRTGGQRRAGGRAIAWRSTGRRRRSR